MDGRAIPQPVEGSGPAMAIACRAVDLDTGKPVGGAEVTFSVEQSRDADGEESHTTLVERKVTTGDDGSFTIRVPLQYLPDPSPKRDLDVRVEIRHPRYVETFDSIGTKELIEKPIADDFPEFRTMKLATARVVTGRLLGPDGKPLADVHIWKQYSDFRGPRDSDFPKTDAEGRFRTNVVAKAALSLSIHHQNVARTTIDVPADATDLGDIRLNRGVAVNGRVLDGDGNPVQGLSVTLPKAVAAPRTGLITISSQVVFATDKQGWFHAPDTPDGRYLVKIGAIFQDEDGKNTGMAIKDAPGVYVSTPIEIKGRPIPDLTIRPVPHVRFVATLETTRPKDDPRPEADENEPEPKTDAEIAAAFYEAFAEIPNFVVQGKVNGVDWASEFSFVAASEKEGVYPVRVAKGLEEARIVFGGFPQRFRLDPEGPELFGPVIRVGRVDSARPEIRIRRYRRTTLRVETPKVDGLKVEARYAREPEMKALGVEFTDAPLLPLGANGKYRLSILPDEDVDLTVTAAGHVRSVTARARLTEGESRTLPISIKAGR